MWGAGAPGPDAAAFTAAISRRMQVPARLRLLEGPGAPEPEGPPAAFQMHVPDRLCLAEMLDVAPGPPFGAPPLPGEAPSGPAVQAAVHGEHPFLSLVSSSGAQKRKRPGLHSRARKERGGSTRDGPHLGTEAAARRQSQDWPEQSLAPRSRPRALLLPAPQFPLFPLPGPRIYSPQNVLRALRFLAQRLVQRLRRPPPAPGSPSSREVTLVLESPLEEFGPTDLLAMRKQLMGISGRLRALEEQSMDWRQKQLLFCSILVSACILNMWLWLRR